MNTSEAGFTKGPWKLGEYVIWPAHGGDAQFPIHARKRGRIALALTKPADARLIAAAPDLLGALQALIADRDKHGWPDFPASALAREAIAKALGK